MWQRQIQNYAPLPWLTSLGNNAKTANVERVMECSQKDQLLVPLQLRFVNTHRQSQDVQSPRLYFYTLKITENWNKNQCRSHAQFPKERNPLWNDPDETGARKQTDPS